MATYTKVFADTYPNGWQAKPDTSTPYTTDVKNNEDATFRAIEDYLYNNPIGDITSASIKDLADVSSTSPTAGQTLVWDSTEGEYVPGTPASSITDLTDVDSTTSPSAGQALIWDGTISKYKPGNISSKLKELSDVLNYGVYESGMVPVLYGNTANSNFYLEKLSIFKLGCVDPSEEYSPDKKTGDALVYDRSDGYFKLQQVVSPTIDQQYAYNTDLVLCASGDGTGYTYSALPKICLSNALGFYTGPYHQKYASIDGTDDDESIIWGAHWTVDNITFDAITETPSYVSFGPGIDPFKVIIEANLIFDNFITDPQTGYLIRTSHVIPLGGKRSANDIFSINLKKQETYDDPSDPYAAPTQETTVMEYYVTGFTDLRPTGQNDYACIDLRCGYMIYPDNTTS